MQERYEVVPDFGSQVFRNTISTGANSSQVFPFTSAPFIRTTGTSPPKEALVAIRKELGGADLGKPASAAADP